MPLAQPNRLESYDLWVEFTPMTVHAILFTMRSVAAWNIADILVTALIALVTGLLFSWWIGAVVFLTGLAFILCTKGKAPVWLSKKRASDRRESGEWLEEWHDDMRRRQIGPYEWRD